ncbi:MAG: biopolymer transporter ExbD [Kiritimatiellae bacterium]|nr:biopolymer transporter ExbD [Kiritimatiellia bacterium]
MTNSWRWAPARSLGIWRHGPGWLRPFLVVAPWLTLFVLLLMFLFIGGTMTVRPGMAFDLPDGGGFADDEPTSLVALIAPAANGDFVFFDDARYSLDESPSRELLGRHLAERTAASPDRAVLVFVDRAVSSGRLMDFAALARGSGVERLLFAEKKEMPAR